MRPQQQTNTFNIFKTGKERASTLRDRSSHARAGNDQPRVIRERPRAEGSAERARLPQQDQHGNTSRLQNPARELLSPLATAGRLEKDQSQPKAGEDGRGMAAPATGAGHTVDACAAAGSRSHSLPHPTPSLHHGPCAPLAYSLGGAHGFLVTAAAACPALSRRVAHLRLGGHHTVSS